MLAFRLAVVDDADAIADLVNAAFRIDPTDEVYVIPGPRTEACVTSAKAIREKIAQPDVAVFVGADPDHPDTLLAHASLTQREDGAVAWLGLFAVAPGRQKSGCGLQTFAYAEQWARTHWPAVQRLEFDVIQTRSGLRAWYEKRECHPKLDADGSVITSPFPYASHGDGWPSVIRGDLHFVVYSKALR